MDNSDTTEMGTGPVVVEESDSGDSLFLTQIPQNLIPNAAGLPRLSPRSMPISPRFLEDGSTCEDEDENEDEGSLRRRKRHPQQHKYNFPFLNQKKLQLRKDQFLHTARNRAIHHSAVEGFFKCIGEMWPNGQRRESFESTLPTVDTGNEEITPITEDDESGEEDVKIIPKRLFVYSIQPKITKSSQPWFKSLRNKIAETTKPTRKSVSQQHFGMEKTPQSTSNVPEDLSRENSVCVILDSSSDSDETFIEESIKPSDHGNVLSSLDESVDNESQSILQNKTLDIRGRHFDNIYVKELLSTKTRDTRLEYENGIMNRSMSQESIYLFEDYSTSYQSPHRHKDNTPGKTDSNNLTENNGDTAEKLDDVESDLEATSLTELVPASCNHEKQVKEQNLPKDAELLLCTNDDDNNGDRTVHKKKDYMENDEEEQKRTNSDSLQIVNNLEEVKGQSLPEDAELQSCQNVDIQDNGDSTVHKKKKHKKKKGDVDNKKTEQSGTNLGNNQEKEVSGQSLPEDSELLSCPKVDFEDNGDVNVHKKKKKKGDVENEETEKNCTNLHPQQILNNLGKEVPGQCLPEDTKLLSCENVDIPNNSEGTVRKKKKHKKKNSDVENNKEQNGTYLDPLQMESNGQSDDTAVDISDNKRKHKKKRKAARDCDDEFALKEFQLDTNKNASSGLVESQEISKLVNNYNTDAHCLARQGDESVSVRKKKKSCVSSAEKEQNGTYLDPLQIKNYGQSDDNTAMDMSDMSDNERKHKKKAVSDEDLALKKLHNTDKNSSSGLVRNHENSELTDTACLVIQGDESVSVMKKKKKRKVHPIAETVENVTLDVSQSGDGHGADGLDISTNYIESAENNTCLQETELGNKVKKKNRNSELNNLGPVMENPEMNECNKGSDCDSTEVNQPPNDESDCLKKKKKKKKTTRSEHCPTGMGKATAGGVKESAVLGPKESACPERKKRDKKRQFCGGESVLVETSEETELEQSTVKRKKHKRCFKDHEQTVSTPLHVEISPSSGKLKKNGQAKVKKKLYNPNDNFYDTH